MESFSNVITWTQREETPSRTTTRLVGLVFAGVVETGNRTELHSLEEIICLLRDGCCGMLFRTLISIPLRSRTLNRALLLSNGIVCLLLADRISEMLEIPELGSIVYAYF